MTQFCEKIAYCDLAQQFSTPLYVYSQAALDEALDTYIHAFADTQPLICYAVKANSNLSILHYLAQRGCGFDIVSGGELARVLAAGGNASKTVFSGVGKSVEEITFALKSGIKCFNVESLAELDRINHIAAAMNTRAPISLRINPDVDAQTHPYISTGLKQNKFGISMNDAESAYQYAASLDHIEICGIDCHIGSQLINLDPLIEACERLLILIDKLHTQGIILQHLDLGGGIGIVYHDETPPNLYAYAQAIKQLLHTRSLQLILEPGRSLIGNAGILLTRVEYIKQHDNKSFVITDAAMNDLIRPALYQSYHHIENNHINSQTPTYCADIVGPICETGDFLAQDRLINAIAGDLLIVHSAGAYAASMASNYNSRCRAAEVWVNGNQVKLIRQRENIDQLLANERACLNNTPL